MIDIITAIDAKWILTASLIGIGWARINCLKSDIRDLEKKIERDLDHQKRFEINPLDSSLTRVWSRFDLMGLDMEHIKKDIEELKNL